MNDLAKSEKIPNLDLPVMLFAAVLSIVCLVKGIYKFDKDNTDLEKQVYEEKFNEHVNIFVSNSIELLGFLPNFVFLIILIWGLWRKKDWIKNFSGVYFILGVGTIIPIMLSISKLFVFWKFYL